MDSKQLERLAELPSDTPFFIRKNGMYYAHNSCGYVTRAETAELYDKAYALQHAEMCEEAEAIPLTDMISTVEHVQEYIDRLEAMRDFIAKLEAQADD